MVYTIRPPVRWLLGLSALGGWIKTALFFIGALGGAMVTGLIATVIGSWFGLEHNVVGSGLLAGLAVYLAASDLGISNLRLPSREHQVVRRTILRHEWLGTLPYGFALGTGFWTWINISLPYLLVFILVVQADFGLALWVAAGFAAGRAAPIGVWSFFPHSPIERFSGWIELWEQGKVQGISAALVIATAARVVAS
jgi:hypothetical protein